MDFSKALQYLKGNASIARKGWNGKGMCVFLRPATVVPVAVIPKMNSIPAPAHDRMIATGAEVYFDASICMRTAQGTYAAWTPSNADVLAEDWEVVA